MSKCTCFPDKINPKCLVHGYTEDLMTNWGASHPAKHAQDDNDNTKNK